MPSLSHLYHRVYDSICGSHPRQRPWHFQWLMARSIRGSLRDTLAPRKGSLLDVGCGDKPYRSFCPGVELYVGMDIFPGPEVDLLIGSDEVMWPVSDGEFDTVLCTEVVEHASHLELFKEMWRVSKPGALYLATVPFIYGEHGAPHDYLRLSVHGLRRMAEDAGWQVVEVRRVGRIGTCVGTMALNWMDAQLSGSVFREGPEGGAPAREPCGKPARERRLRRVGPAGRHRRVLRQRLAAGQEAGALITACGSACASRPCGSTATAAPAPPNR